MRRLAATLLALAVLLAPPAGATWSIVLVDTGTGEVAVGTATCLEGFDLLKYVPVIVVGRGAGAAQSAVDGTAANRKEIYDNLLLGTPPSAIIDVLLEGDLQWKARQYGIADLSPAAAGYTGGAAMQYKEHVTGTSGTLTWAIQGNVLTGAPVLAAAEAAVLSTPGSLADRLMAGMEAARLMGGDGRCSCLTGGPQSCGSPPPAFEKSAHVGCVVVARIGDVDGGCEPVQGCAKGSYWLKLNVKGQQEDDPDPVLQLHALYAGFLAGLHGRPDGLRSVASFDHGTLLADGQSTRTLHLALYDHFGAPITTGGASVTVSHAPGSAGLGVPGPVTDHGDGTYSLSVTAGAASGTDLFAVRVDDGTQPATLYPYPTLELVPALRADAGSLGAGAGGVVELSLQGPSATADRDYWVALSASGTQPGQVLPTGVVLPLNADRLFGATPSLVSVGLLGGVPGVLDRAGAATAALQPAPGALAPLAGLSLACAWFTVRPPDFASNAILIEILP